MTHNQSNNEQNKAKSLIFMVEPASFRANEETLKTNKFQNKQINTKNVNELALKEFNQLKEKLIEHGISVYVEKDIPERNTPDAIFPNNWISFHNSNKVILYPMLAENRRRERSLNTVHQIARSNQLQLGQVIDLSFEEDNGKFLEGTGSMVFDHYSNKIYACISERTHAELLNKIGNILNYKLVIFHSFDQNSHPIYHTNVMMAIGDKFCVICSESINDKDERQHVIESLISDKKDIIDISYKQMNNFCGNIIQLKSKNNQSIIAMSKSAFENFTDEQIKKLKSYGTILSSDISTIEHYGGGSVRCMICEVS
ncbi:arginine deiminase-related protein [Thiotrichales bacterium 19S11-10]|nr:arginine deiminase-related protein [Thiotrichales bacterium 19S11-10]